MRTSIHLFVGLTVALSLNVLVASAADDDIEEDKGVLVLTTANFDKAITEHEHVLVEFYAPWCGHCKSLAPEYEKAAEELSSSGSKIKLAKVDATVEKALGDEYKVQGFPTLKFFRKGKAAEYAGPREAAGIVAWLLKKTGPPAATLRTAAEASALTADKEVVVIGFFKDLDGADAKQFVKAAEDNDDQMFAVTTAKEVRDKYDVKKDSAIVLIKKFDEGRNDYDGKMKAEDINKFARANAIPLINEFSQETAGKIFGSDVKVHLLLLAGKEDKDLEAMMEAIKPAAKDNKGKMIFVHVDSDVAENAQVLDFFGLKKEQCPDYIIYEMEKSAKYLSGKKSVKAKEVKQFVKDYFAGKLKRTLKSEELPDDWNEKPVKVLVSSNFKSVALDKEKDVFVEFYAPWCGHCKSLTPKWDELAERFAKDPNIVIAKMDSTANEVEEVTVEGFPTLKLFKKGSNEVVDYNGKREVEDMVRFLETGEQSSGKEEDKEDEDDDSEEEEEEEEDDTRRDEL